MKLFQILALSCALLITPMAFAAVNVNTADAQTIASELNGVGMKKAESIVEYRKKHGPFKSIEDLLEVKGIGAATLEKNKENIKFK
jgi:competence protein ComEA